jgi:branched-chain amino acid transport system permease protein
MAATTANPPIAARSHAAVLWVGGTVLLALLPLLLSSYVTFQATLVVTNALALLGLVLVTGISGQLSLAQGAFFGIGAYTAAILMEHAAIPYPLVLPASALVCFLAGWLIGFPALRLTPLYLVLATFALAVAVPTILKLPGIDDWTGGVQGLILSRPHAPFDLPLERDYWLYLYCLAITAPLFWTAHNLIKSRFGRACMALRDNPIAAQAMGINSAWFKTTAFGLGAMYTGVAGALNATIVGYVAPDSFNFFLSITLLVGAVVGGLVSLPGAAIGALFVVFVPNLAESVSPALSWAVYGVILIGLMWFAPAGVAGVIGDQAGRLLRRRPHPSNTDD